MPTDPARQCVNLPGVALCLCVDRQAQVHTKVVLTAASQLFSSSLILMRCFGP